MKNETSDFVLVVAIDLHFEEEHEDDDENDFQEESEIGPTGVCF